MTTIEISIKGVQYVLLYRDIFVEILKKSIANWSDSSFMPQYIDIGKYKTENRMYYLYEIRDSGCTILVLSPRLDGNILVGFVVGYEQDGKWKYYDKVESFGCNTWDVEGIRGMYPFYRAE